MTAHPKPGEKEKSPKIWNTKSRIHDIAKPDELVCSNCNMQDKSCVFCHPEDEEIKYIYGGRGTGEKVNDDLTSLLCLKCRTLMDVKPAKDASRRDKLEHSLLWSKSIIKTLISKLEQLQKKYEHSR